MTKPKARLLQIILIWVVLSLILQFSVYAILDYQITKVLAPLPLDSVNIVEIIVPTTEVKGPKLSQSRRFIAYLNDNALEIYDLTLGKVVFAKPSSSDGKVVGYSWLPDRDNLIYLFSGKVDSPNPSGSMTDAAHLFTLEFSKGKETPEDRYNDIVANFPTDGVITNIGISTFTNILYVIIDQTNYSTLMEIDVMKNTKITSRSGEMISNIAVSDKKGILYLESSIPSTTKKIFAVDGWKRNIIEDNAESVLLGYQSGQLYLGKKIGNNLEEIKMVTENAEDNSFLNEQVIWQGHLPFSDKAQTGIVSSGKIAILNSVSLFIIENEAVKEIAYSGSKNYLAADGQTVIQLTKESDFTKIKLIPVSTY